MMKSVDDFLWLYVNAILQDLIPELQLKRQNRDAMIIDEMGVFKANSAICDNPNPGQKLLQQPRL